MSAEGSTGSNAPGEATTTTVVAPKEGNSLDPGGLNPLHYILIGLLTIVVFAIVGYVAYRCWKQKKQPPPLPPRKVTPFGKRGTGGNTVDDVDSERYFGPRKEDPRMKALQDRMNDLKKEIRENEDGVQETQNSHSGKRSGKRSSKRKDKNDKDDKTNEKTKEIDKELDGSKNTRSQKSAEC